jgi:hypothetical protein
MAENIHMQIQVLSLGEIAKYHKDAVNSLRFYFNESAESSAERFFGYTSTERKKELEKCVNETCLRSMLIILTSLEAHFYRDYKYRAEKKFKRDDLSKTFREMYKKKEFKVSLEQDIFEAWKMHRGDKKALISALKMAFDLRNWLAHGRYRQPKFGRHFDYDYIYDLAVEVNEEFFSESSVTP